MDYKVIDGGVTASAGFKASGAEAGIKYSGRMDMALVYSEKPCDVAGTFTTNVVKAAPVLWDKKLVEDGNKVNAVVLNSGIANACTGDEGMDYNYKMASLMGEQLGVAPEAVLTASTGVIGMQLRVEPIEKGVKLLKDALSDSREGAKNAATAIMTTDTVSKESAVAIDIDGVEVHIGGMSKGSGMIHPNMATMLSVITTDAKVDAKVLQAMLSESVDGSFNMISVDRDTSTNDTCLLLANGVSGVEITDGSEAYKKFKDGLTYVTTDLAKQMAADGEGATKLFEVTVVNAASKEDAKVLSKSVITSNLVKTAVYGSDANWGRILCALGYSGVDFDFTIVDIILKANVDGKDEELVLVKDGVATDYSEDFATKMLSQSKVTVVCDMKQGDAKATAWGCDLTYDYVKINGDYRS